MRFKDPKRIILAHLNINSIRNKFDILKNSVSGKIDILVVSETKLDASFPDTQFFIEGFSRPPYRFDRNKNGGGILVYIRNDITSRLISEYKLPDKVEGIL